MVVVFNKNYLFKINKMYNDKKIFIFTEITNNLNTLKYNNTNSDGLL